MQLIGMEGKAHIAAELEWAAKTWIVLAAGAATGGVASAFGAGATTVGVVSGLGAQGASDLVEGEFSGVDDYIIAGGTGYLLGRATKALTTPEPGRITPDVAPPPPVDAPPGFRTGPIEFPPPGADDVAFGLTRAERIRLAAHRPGRYRAGVVERGLGRAKMNGRVFDPNTGDELIWDATKTRTGQWDMGHLPGKSYEQLRQRFINGEISRTQFLDEYNNPLNYRPEAPSPNRSRRFN
jgi:HNH/ENDO VII superfamily nuclease